MQEEVSLMNTKRNNVFGLMPKIFAGKIKVKKKSNCTKKRRQNGMAPKKGLKKAFDGSKSVKTLRN